ncbi:MAG TPA: peptidylprolyl isomerase [Thermoanaerobaculia bacterium]|nr:peptidylprolyl isomerase [Thermoanaerobaculia bacterium]HQN06432.1 peptidylprolyl isomerase [Thermoanaerobaculia bacterium]HQP86832.1 peptidylprolyl isomerase [Thermoanaerobaculia bacterium]
MALRGGARRVGAASLPILALVLTACSSVAPDADRHEARPERLALVARLLEMEDRRAWDDAPGQAAAASPDARLRERAALAAGRLRATGAVPLLSTLLADLEPRVRRAAAFASGLAGERRLVPLLRSALSDADPGTAAAAASALGRLGGDAAEEALRGVLRARSGPVAAAAAALYRSKDPGLVPLLAAAAASPDGETRRMAAWSLARVPRPGSESALRALLRAGDPEVVAWAARGLGLLGDAEAAGPLSEVALGPEPGPAIQALLALERLAAGGLARDVAREAGLARRGDPHPGVSLAALTLLRAAADDADVRALLERVVVHGGRRGGVALASLAAGDAERAHALAFPGKGTAPLDLRLGAAEALPLLAAERVGPWLEALLGDSAPRVRMEAVSRLPRPLVPRSLPLLTRALADLDGAVRAAALDATAPFAAGTGSDARLAAAWRAAFDALVASGEADLAATALDAAASLPAGGRELLAAKRDAADDLVRERARRLLRERFGVDSTDPSPAVATRLAAADTLRLAERAEGPPVRVVVETSRGSFEAELFADAAPMTVESFVSLARAGFFDGTTIHRVVPDFVVQAGDPRGDGTGGPGYAIRDELNPIPYVRGRLGMALSGPDTGGSQWFVALSRQPHLDAAYTVFGEVTAGMEVVDRVEQNDRLLSVRVREEPGPGEDPSAGFPRGVN